MLSFELSERAAEAQRYPLNRGIGFMKSFALVITIYLAAVSMSVHALGNDTPLWTKFDEYSEISQKSQQQRLKNFVFQLRAVPNQIAIIVAYGGEKTCPEEAKLRASRVRQLLLKSGIDAQRIRVVDAGYQRRWTISLFIGPPDAPPITPQYLSSFDGHLDLNKVKMFRSCAGLKSRHTNRRPRITRAW